MTAPWLCCICPRRGKIKKPRYEKPHEKHAAADEYGGIK